MKPTMLRPIGEGPVVVFTGRLIKAKGPLELLEAWPLLLREVPDAHLVLVGSGPIADAKSDGEQALRVPVKAPQKLAGALATILTQPALVARLSRAARKRAETDFSQEAVVGHLEALYREVCARRHRENRCG